MDEIFILHRQNVESVIKYYLKHSLVYNNDPIQIHTPSDYK